MIRDFTTSEEPLADATPPTWGDAGRAAFTKGFAEGRVQVIRRSHVEWVHPAGRTWHQEVRPSAFGAMVISLGAPYGANLDPPFNGAISFSTLKIQQTQPFGGRSTRSHRQEDAAVEQRQQD